MIPSNWAKPRAATPRMSGLRLTLRSFPSFLPVQPCLKVGPGMSQPQDCEVPPTRLRPKPCPTATILAPSTLVRQQAQIAIFPKCYTGRPALSGFTHLSVVPVANDSFPRKTNRTNGGRLLTTLHLLAPGTVDDVSPHPHPDPCNTTQNAVPPHDSLVAPGP